MFRKTFNQQGMLAILGAISMCIVTAALLLGYFVFSAKQQSKKRHECRMLGLETLQIITDAMNEVTRLNPSAVQLQAQQKRAEILLETASTPHLLAIAIANYEKVKFQQKAFHQKQLQIIRSAKQRANLYLQSMAWQKHLQSQQPVEFLLQPFPPTSDSPIYLSLPGIEKRQETKIQWKKMDNINVKQNIIQGQCVTTIKKEKKWHPILAEDKVL